MKDKTKNKTTRPQVRGLQTKAKTKNKTTSQRPPHEGQVDQTPNLAYPLEICLDFLQGWSPILPRTCCSSDVMSVTASWRLPSLVWGLSGDTWSVTIRPSSLNAPFMSRTRTLLNEAITANACKNQENKNMQTCQKKSYIRSHTTVNCTRTIKSLQQHSTSAWYIIV